MPDSKSYIQLQISGARWRDESKSHALSFLRNDEFDDMLIALSSGHSLHRISDIVSLVDEYPSICEILKIRFPITKAALLCDLQGLEIRLWWLKKLLKKVMKQKV
jgi:hypothetical protein